MLSKALLRNTAVRVLVLTDCELGRDGARVLAEMLSRNASLNELVRDSLPAVLSDLSVASSAN